MKKLLLACCLICLSMTATAGSPYVAPSLFIQNTTSETDNFRGLHPRLSIGYQDIINYLYLAGEIYIVPATIPIAESDSTRPYSVRTVQELGASFIPGLYISEYIIGYLRLGLVGTKFWGPDVTKTGAEFGVGLQSQLSDNWSIRIEYITYFYPSISTIGTPTTDQYGIGLVYRLQ